MPDLKSLKFTTIPPTDRNPTLARREKLIERLEEQKALVDSPTMLRTVQRSTKKGGERVTTEKQIKVHPWWRPGDKGSLVFFIRVGWKAIEFEKGKPGVIVASKDQLKPVIDVLIAATEKGELDEALAQASKSAAIKKTARKAA